MDNREEDLAKRRTFAGKGRSPAKERRTAERKKKARCSPVMLKRDFMIIFGMFRSSISIILIVAWGLQLSFVLFWA